MFSVRRLVLPLFLALPLLSQDAAPPPGTDVAAEPASAATRVEIPVEVWAQKGDLRRELTAADFAVTEGGTPRRVVDVRPLTGEPWRFVVYVDRVLSGTRSVRAATGALAERLTPLVGLGTVELVVAEPEPRVVVEATRSAAVLDEALSRLFLLGEGRDDVRQARQRFRDDLRGLAEDDDPVALAMDAVEEEARLVRRQQQRLAAWLAGRERGRPSVLFLVSDGFDLDPRGFYLAEIPKAEAPPRLAETLAPHVLDRDALETSRLTAALGWTVFPLPMGDESLPDVRRWRPMSKPGAPIGMSVTLPGGSKGTADEKPAAPLPSLLAPGEPLRWIAEAGGGLVLTSRAEVAEAVARLRSRWLVGYETARPEAGPSLPVQVAILDPKLAIRSRRWEGPVHLEEVAALRAREALAGEESAGSLQVSAQARLAPVDGDPAARLGLVEVRLDEGSPPDGSRWRLSFALPAGGGGAEVSHRPLTSADLLSDPEGWTWRGTVPLPPDAEQLAVVVEDLESGTWGGDVAALSEGEEEETEAEAVAPAVAPAPSPGAELRGFGVRILEPAPGRRMGAVEVSAEVRVPEGRRVERVEFFWNNELAGTVYGPPFRHRVRVPADKPEGYVRVTALLDDGSTTEDAVPLNGANVGDRLDVRLRELYVVVTDRSGKPVRGLPRGRFRVRQAGIDQEIATFEDAGTMPLTVALAIDSSASMFRKLENVQRAAASLLRGGLATRDSALLVDFDTKPRLVTRPTNDLTSVARSLDLLRADGSTGLWEAVAFSLEQLGNVSGRKALIVYSDGVGEGEPFSYRTTLRLARRSGVPVYLIVTNAESVYRSGGSLRPYASKLRDVATASGGTVYFMRAEDDLTGVYHEILAELRSQYTLAFYPKDQAQVWQEVRVDVQGDGLTARTVSGYEGE